MDKRIELSTLKNEVVSCTNCSTLCSTRTQVVFGDGNINARIMFVGEAPGENEDKKGIPFVGKAGEMLDSMIKACKWDRKDVYIANVVNCRPPKNRVPTAEEIGNCANYLLRQIELVNPEIIICLGSVASNTVVGLPVSQARGHWYYHRHHKVMCTYHPSFLLRQPEARALAWHDLKMVIEAIKNDKVV